jgi:hypothetical protein
MKRWLSIAVLTVIVVLIWVYNEQHPPKSVRLAATWMQPYWRVSLGEEGPNWVRLIELKNIGEKPIVASAIAFAGDKPSAKLMEFMANYASSESDLNPGEVRETTVGSWDDPAKGLRYMAFSCTAAELRRRLDLRARYPLIQMLWPLPSYIFDIPANDPKPGEQFEALPLPDKP